MTKEQLVSLTVDGVDIAAVRLQRASAADWIAGPVSSTVVNQSLGTHAVVLTSGEHVGWEAAAGHAVTLDRTRTFLFGKQAFEDRTRSGAAALPTP